MNRIGFLLSIALGLIAVLGTTPDPADAQQATFPSEHYTLRLVPVVEGLQNPWSIAFLPNGDMLVTERPGRLRIVRSGVLEPDPVEGIPAVRVNGQAGLLDVQPHPDFATNSLLYLSLVKVNTEGTAGSTVVIRGRLEGNRLLEVEEIFDVGMWNSGRDHFGSRLAFDDQGYLFITVGEYGNRVDPENQRAHPAQDLSNYLGTVVRLHDDGRIPDDNPFASRADAQPGIWSYGHRSPQGLAIHPETGDIWETEHGPQGGDELNLIRRGANYGWPVIGFGVDYGGGIIHVGTELEGLEQPVHYWVPSIATSGLLIYSGDRYPDWRGNFFVGGLAGQKLARLSVDGQRVTGEETLFEGIGRVREIVQGPDGYIYLALDARGGGTSPVLRIEVAN